MYDCYTTYNTSTHLIHLFYSNEYINEKEIVKRESK